VLFAAGRPSGTEARLALYPALKRWAKIGRPSGAGIQEDRGQRTLRLRGADSRRSGAENVATGRRKRCVSAVEIQVGVGKGVGKSLDP